MLPLAASHFLETYRMLFGRFTVKMKHAISRTFIFSKDFYVTNPNLKECFDFLISKEKLRLDRSDKQKKTPPQTTFLWKKKQIHHWLWCICILERKIVAHTLQRPPTHKKWSSSIPSWSTAPASAPSILNTTHCHCSPTWRSICLWHSLFISFTVFSMRCNCMFLLATSLLRWSMVMLLSVFRSQNRLFCSFSRLSSTSFLWSSVYKKLKSSPSLNHI